jgi:hypothetical protein
MYRVPLHGRSASLPTRDLVGYQLDIKCRCQGLVMQCISLSMKPGYVEVSSNDDTQYPQLSILGFPQSVRYYPDAVTCENFIINPVFETFFKAT